MQPAADPLATVATPLRVLLIEDNPGDARLMTEMLKQGAGLGLAAELRHAPTLAAAAEQLRAGPVDLVLLDLGLPESQGLETFQRLQALVSPLPMVIVQSGLDDERVAMQALQAGAQDYLIKGRVDAPTLARAIRYAIGRHQAEQAHQRERERERELELERTGRLQAEGESQALRRLLDEREAMLRLLAHEVRQPLHNAAAALDAAAGAIARPGEPEGAEARQCLEQAQHVLDHVIGTLNNTLAAATMLTAGEPGPLAEVDLDALIDLVVHDIGPDERPRITVHSGSELRTAQLQPATMRLALCNLLVNALTYSPPGAPVRLSVFDGDDPPTLCFEVADQGGGIAAELLPRVFDKGTRGANARPGTGAGLGLYIVRHVVERHHGRIEVLPAEPHGTIVRIHIPQGIEA
jgi:signal transduction histidine kinase